MAIKLLFGRESWRLGNELPGTGLTVAVGFVIGVISALMGIGGGAYSALFLTLYGVSIHRAVATSSGVGVLISVPGVIGYMIAGWPQQALMPPLSVGYVSFLAVALFAPVSHCLHRSACWRRPMGRRWHTPGRADGSKSPSPFSC